MNVELSVTNKRIAELMEVIKRRNILVDFALFDLNKYITDLEKKVAEYEKT